MKKSELKEMIKQAMLGEEMDVPVTQPMEAFSTTNMPQMDRLKFYAGTMVKANLRNLGVDLKDPMSTNNDIYIDGVDDIAAMLRDDRDMEAEQHAEAIADQISNKISLEEAEKEEDEDIEVEDIKIDAEEETSDKEEDIEVESNAEAGITGDAKKVQDNLEAALISAKELGDQKLVDQIGNSITFFTRTHVVGSEEVSEGEIDINVDDNAADAEAAYAIEEAYEKRRMLKIAGLK